MSENVTVKPRIVRSDPDFPILFIAVSFLMFNKYLDGTVREIVASLPYAIGRFVSGVITIFFELFHAKINSSYFHSRNYVCFVSGTFF